MGGNYSKKTNISCSLSITGVALICFLSPLGLCSFGVKTCCRWCPYTFSSIDTSQQFGVQTIRVKRLILVINFLSDPMLCLTIKTNKDLRAWCISFGDRWYFSQPERKIVLAKWFKASFESSTTPSKPSHIAIWNWMCLLIIHDCFLSWSTYFVKFIGAETYGSCPCVLLVNLNKVICHHRTSHHGSLQNISSTMSHKVHRMIFPGRLC